MSAIDYDLTPFLVIWEATRACHLACAHCRATAIRERHPEELTTAEGRALMDQVLAMGCRQLVITGGDPMLRPDLYELISYGVRQGLRVSICHSATQLLTAEAIQELQNAGISQMALSVDGATAVTHNHFRGRENTYEQTLLAIATAQRIRLPLQINTTVCRINRHELPDIAEQVAAWGAVLWSVFMLVPAGRGRNLDQLTPQEHEEVYNWLADLQVKVPFSIKTTEGQPYRRVLLQKRRGGGSARPDTYSSSVPESDTLSVSMSDPATLGSDAAKPFRPHPDATRANQLANRRPTGIYDGKGFCFVSHRGDVCPSGFLELSGGNVRQRPLVDIYRYAPLFRQLRDTDLLHGKCGRCEYRHVCGGSRARAFNLTGDYMASDPTCVYEPKFVRSKLHELMAAHSL